MPTYNTPGVYIEEVSTLPPSVAAVSTAIPAFIGYTEATVDALGVDRLQTPTRISSLLEYEAYFGRAPLQAFSVVVDKRVDSNSRLLDVRVQLDGSVANNPPATPTRLMYYSLQLYFANGGGPCYIYSLGTAGGAPQLSDFTAAVSALESVDEVTLLAFPDACRLTAGQHGDLVEAALRSCNATQDRFTIADVHGALPTGVINDMTAANAFRTEVGLASVDFLKYGAAYFPFLRTSLPWLTSDASITISAFNDVTVDNAGAEASNPNATLSGVLLSSTDIQGTATTAGETAVLNAVKIFISQQYVTMPPSAAVAGVYATVDRNRGVWKAPANVGLSRVIEPTVPITNVLQDQLNVDSGSGKSINALRAFTGKGTLVWGARTLAGNDSENRYVSVRRFLNFAEESIGEALDRFVFEPNDANTWVKVRSMIENFLLNQWREGALVGPKPEQAFRVTVGLNQTMSAAEVLEGIMRVRVELAISRPAEFIILVFSQTQQQA